MPLRMMLSVMEGLPRAQSDPPPRPKPRALAFVGDDVALVEGLRCGNPAARAALFDRHAPHIKRVLLRVLGLDAELADVLHDVFVEALGSLNKLEDGRALKAWLTSIAVFTARGRIRRRQRRRWLRLVAPADLPEQPSAPPSAELSEALRCSYAVLEELPVDERMAFALRFIEGMELVELAAACGCSLATIKRRLSRAQQHFFGQARKHPALQSWIEQEPSCTEEAR